MRPLATATIAPLGLALALAATIGCGGQIGERGSGSYDPSRPGSGGPGGPSGPGSPGNGANPGPGGGSMPGGGPSTPPTGGGGSGPPPLTLPDGGADAATSADGGAMGPGGMAEPGCRVTITALNPPRFVNLLAGTTSRLRVQAKVTGAMAPAMPAWQWQVQLGPLSEVPVTKLTPEGDVVEFPLASEGSYAIRASAGPDCMMGTASAGASRPDARMTYYWARVTPPRASGLPTHDAQISIGGTSQPTKFIALSPGVKIEIEPQNSKEESIRSYVRVSSRASSVRLEGNTLANPFVVELLGGRRYDVLIVPEGPVAPALLADRSAAELMTEQWVLDPGLLVTGTVQRTRAGANEPVIDARVFLRAGNLPSSIGRTTPAGAFELRARDGRFQVAVIPAAGSGLPEAHLPEGITYPLAQAGSVQLTYAALQSGTLELTVRSSDGQRPVPDARVRLEADPASLGPVGNFRLSTEERDLPAVGALRVEAATNTTGIASFAGLPFGRYRALVAPPVGMADAATTVATVELRAAAVPATVTLARPVRLTGKLLPPSLSAGLKLLAIEADGPTPGETVTATVDAAGQFSLPVAPGRSYRLQIEPAQERKLPRLFLGPHTAGMADSSYGEVTLSEGVPVVGHLTNGSAPVPGAVVQIFCTGAPPDCMDENSPQLETARPLAETRAGADGTFQVFLPDPARWDL